MSRRNGRHIMPPMESPMSGVQPLEPGDPAQIGAYRLLGRLGAGGMGQVFLGVSRGGRKVAVKVLRADLVTDAEFQARFAREVAAVGKRNGRGGEPRLELSSIGKREHASVHRSVIAESESVPVGHCTPEVRRVRREKKNERRGGK